ncbi:hypothetical protein PUNSTDRAFT_23416, partial [Punctularia strigosozonata HHB-11173 SS5]
MIYIGVADGMETNFKFMRLPNNVIFTSAHALFDETLFPKCAKQKQTKNTRIGGPRSKDTNHPSGQPPVPWDDDDEIPSAPIPTITPEKGKGKAPDSELSPPPEDEPAPVPSLPPQTPRKSDNPSAPETPFTGYRESTSKAPSSESDSEGDARLAKLCQEGGVQFVEALLLRAYPLFGGNPNQSNVKEWTYRDIQRLKPAEQKEWRAACRDELEALRK